MKVNFFKNEKLAAKAIDNKALNQVKGGGESKGGTDGRIKPVKP